MADRREMEAFWERWLEATGDRGPTSWVAAVAAMPAGVPRGALSPLALASLGSAIPRR
ncbi:MAG: hypothetical protein HYU61_10745, partial [Brevundimonas diminuta]|nr:hypothetical protein [Brevundimonas diminuta]